jgi:hypothetical protein
MKTLSIIVCGRDDDYTPDFMYRLRVALEALARATSAASNAAEVIFVDYAPSRPVRSSVGFNASVPHNSLRYLCVSEEVALERNGSTKYNHADAIQIGIEVAEGQFCLVCPSDTYFLEHSIFELVRLLQRSQSQDCYWIPRYRVPFGYVLNRPNAYLLNHFLSLNCRGFQIDSSHRNIFGNFGAIVAPKAIWLESGGIDGSQQGWGWTDIDFGLRLSYKYRQIDTTGYGITCFDFSDQIPITRTQNTPWFSNNFTVDYKKLCAEGTKLEVMGFKPDKHAFRTSEDIDRKLVIQRIKNDLNHFQSNINVLENNSELNEIVSRLEKLNSIAKINPKLTAEEKLYFYWLQQKLHPVNSLLFCESLNDQLAFYLPSINSTFRTTIVTKFTSPDSISTVTPLLHDNYFHALKESGIRTYYNTNHSSTLPIYFYRENFDHVICDDSEAFFMSALRFVSTSSSSVFTLTVRITSDITRSTEFQAGVIALAKLEDKFEVWRIVFGTLICYFFFSKQYQESSVD